MIRLIEPEDVQRVLGIYTPYITKYNTSFEYEVPTLEEFQQRIANITEQYPWLVCKKDGVIVGYAYAGQHRARTAYQWSVESAIYIAEDFCGKGVGRLLYTKLFELLKQQGYMNVFAGMTAPNERSERLHKSLGFEDVGTFKNIGYKNGAWHDTKWFQLDIGEHKSLLSEPLSIKEIGKNY
ncbi:MAG: N-acetyltransferase [Chitinophagales bacterium]|nr:N-acetyltransferase [Chitinophagales bacterium]